ncbi:MAG TPA: S41 family peptidase [Sphingobacteriaceae bacterium]|nr:S41 family peptidase [Sphingobacteriaceae bacterium]
MQKGTKRNLFVAATYALVLFMGILLGQNYNVQNRQNQPVATPILPIATQEHASKVQRTLDLISGNYVDSVDLDSLQHAIISEMISRLDPHSDYLPPEDARQNSQELEGSFEGIGVEFYLLHDTILVVGMVPNGPAQVAGLKVGDQILAIDDEPIAGVQVSTSKLEKLIKGRKGSVMVATVDRVGTEEPFPLEIVRDHYEVSSIDAGYMLTSNVAYIRISNFGSQTVQDVRQRIESLRKRGATNVLLDLRGNKGGYLSAGIDLAGLFLPDGSPVVYTEGTHDPRTTYTARNGGHFIDMGLVVLIDENSASASEIVAGAIQDYNRGTIIGRRSFGKGVIQERFGLGDGSVLNLTVARYYTPLGRSIQRPQVSNQGLDSGQFMVVQGGIRPDIEVQVDETEQNPLYQMIYRQGLLHEFVYGRLTSGVPAFAIENYLKGYFLPDQEFEEFIDFVEERGMDVGPIKKRGSAETETSEHSLKGRMSAEIEALLARYYFGSDAYFKTKNRRDPVINAALAHLEAKEAVEQMAIPLQNKVD